MSTKECKIPRRYFTADFKARVVLEIISGEKSAAEICCAHDLKPDLLSHWKNLFVANASKVFQSGKKADPQQERIEELERLAGKAEIEILKKAGSSVKNGKEPKHKGHKGAQRGKEALS